MYRVLIIEDEPPAIRQIQILISRYCEKFEVVGIAENGVEALEKARELLPDVMITDVQMPLMNGIEFVANIRQDLPDSRILIISGYSEFQYVQSAISYGVNDYLLKPIVPSDFMNAMGKIENYLEKQFYENRNRLLKKMANNKETDIKEIQHYFLYEKYYLSIIKVKGRLEGEQEQEIYSEKDETFAVYGRSFSEGLFLIPYEVVGNSDIKLFNRKVIKQYQKTDAYFTFVFMEQPVTVCEIPETMKKLYKMLDKNIVIGKTQILSNSDANHEKYGEVNQKEVYKILNEIELELRENEYGKVKKIIMDLFVQWKNEEKTQIYIEYILKQILYLAQKYSGSDIDEKLLATDEILAEILEEANKLEDVEKGFIDILLQNCQDNTIVKVDAPEFLEILKKYVGEHITEDISLSNVCSRFGVSQPYFSKIFRKYTNKSFNQYVTEQKMEKAKEIMRADSTLLIKEVALRVGYTNQFYFSRIFHAYTKMSPSEYFEKISK